MAWGRGTVTHSQGPATGWLDVWVRIKVSVLHFPADTVSPCFVTLVWSCSDSFYLKQGAWAGLPPLPCVGHRVLLLADAPRAGLEAGSVLDSVPSIVLLPCPVCLGWASTHESLAPVFKGERERERERDRQTDRHRLIVPPIDTPIGSFLYVP